MMIPFLIFLASTVAFIVGCACISIYLLPNGTGQLQTRQLVTLSQEVLIEEKAHKQRKSKLDDMGMGECVRRVTSITLGIVAVILFVIIVFVNVTF
jgi:hypothetical protein